MEITASMEIIALLMLVRGSNMPRLSAFMHGDMVKIVMCVSFSPETMRLCGLQEKGIMQYTWTPSNKE